MKRPSMFQHALVALALFAPGAFGQQQFTTYPSQPAGSGAHQRPYNEAYEWQTVAGSYVRLDPTRQFDLQLGGWRHVKQLVVTAEPYSGNANFEVLVNGQVKGTINTPWKSEFVVTVAESTSAITLRHLWGPSINILNIRAYQSCREAADFGAQISPDYYPVQTFRTPASNGGSYLAKKAIRLVDLLRPFADPAGEFVTYLLPIKTAAGRTFAVATAEGDLSSLTQESLYALSKQIIFAEPCINNLMKKDATFDLAVELVSVKHEIEERLD